MSARHDGPDQKQGGKEKWCMLRKRYYSGSLQIRPGDEDILREVLADILRDKKWYGDGEPRWRQGKGDNKKWCKSADEADDDRRKLIKCLRRHASKHPDPAEVYRLANRLNKCRPEARCHSGACPCCMRAFQRWLVVAGERLLKHVERQYGPLKVVSVIPTKAPVEAGDSGDEACKKSGGKIITGNPTNALTRYAKACREADIGFSLAALDFSWNHYPEESGKDKRGSLVAHLWGFAIADEVDAGRNALRESFRKTTKAPRPVRCSKYDGRRQALAYMFKSNFSRRTKTIVKVVSKGNVVSHRNTRSKPLLVAQKLELAVLLNHIGLNGRMVLRNAEFVKTNAGIRLRLVDQDSKPTLAG